MSKLSNVVSLLRPQNLTNLIICGDFNINIQGAVNCHLHSLQQLQLDFDLSQVVNSPTRVSNSTSSTLDLVLLSNPEQLESCDVLPPIGSSDHSSVSVSLSLPQKKRDNKPPTKSVWIYKAADMSKARELLPSLPLSNTTDDVDIAWQKWVKEFVTIMEECIPQEIGTNGVWNSLD